MRADKPDETDGANKRNRNRGQKADRQHGLQPQPTHIDAHAGCLVVTQPKRRQRPCVAHEHRHRNEKNTTGDIDLFPRGLGQAAHGPENDGGERLFGSQIFKQRQCGIEGEHQRDAEKDDSLHGYAAHR
ncbi:hypothetical protein D3C87_1637210 [compost metagenome]